MKYYLPGLAMAALLAGCGGGGSDGADAAGTTTTLPTTTTVEAPAATPSSADPFIAKVVEVIKASSEDARAVQIDSIAITAPEEAMPEPFS
jgi:ABC-type glycerol-3-phosphate transport system substrate-binding protein